MKAAAKAYNIDTLRQLPENKKCFDCQQKVTKLLISLSDLCATVLCLGYHVLPYDGFQRLYLLGLRRYPPGNEPQSQGYQHVCLYRR